MSRRELAILAILSMLALAILVAIVGRSADWSPFGLVLAGEAIGFVGVLTWALLDRRIERRKGGWS